ncbi:glycosyltransferase [Leptolyngbya sp. DQ-M1]|uniref:glycosyltransferase family 2 protein n=1 Tax=Leptolyngbya sp. DQ-M1 TaxID=2933920 RepID=UPI00329759BC
MNPAFDPPLISVIIPAYNAETYIAKTLRSVLTQTYQNLEVIIIDDGSQDRTVEIIQPFAEEDTRVTIVQQSNRGVAAARNTGIQKARGQFIALLDADDFWFPDNLEKQMNCMMSAPPKTGFVYSWSVDIDEHDQMTGDFNAAQVTGDVYLLLLCHNFVGNASSTLIRKECFDRVGGFNERFKSVNAQGCEDWDLYLRIAEAYYCQVIPEFLISYRKSKNSMSRDYFKMAASHALMLQAIRQNHPEIPHLLYQLSISSFYLYFARQSIDNHDREQAHFWLSEALNIDRAALLFRPDYYWLLLKSVLLQRTTSVRTLHNAPSRLSITLKVFATACLHQFLRIVDQGLRDRSVSKAPSRSLLTRS